MTRAAAFLSADGTALGVLSTVALAPLPAPTASATSPRSSPTPRRTPGSPGSSWCAARSPSRRSSDARGTYRGSRACSSGAAAPGLPSTHRQTSGTRVGRRDGEGAAHPGRPRWPCCRCAAVLGLLVLVWAATTGPVASCSATAGRRRASGTVTPTRRPRARRRASSACRLPRGDQGGPADMDRSWLGKLIAVRAADRGVLGVAHGAARAVAAPLAPPPEKPATSTFDVVTGPPWRRRSAGRGRAAGGGRPWRPGDGIVACWVRLEESLAAAGLPPPSGRDVRRARQAAAADPRPGPAGHRPAGGALPGGPVLRAPPRRGPPGRGPLGAAGAARGPAQPRGGSREPADARRGGCGPRGSATAFACWVVVTLGAHVSAAPPRAGAGRPRGRGHRAVLWTCWTGWTGPAPRTGTAGSPSRSGSPARTPG